MLRKALHTVFVLAGIVALVFVLFRALGDPAQALMGQSGDKQTLENIRREWHLDKPAWQQFVYYVADLSPVSIHHASEVSSKQLKGLFIPIGQKVLAFKLPYPGTSYHSQRPVGDMLMEALPATLLLALAAMLFATVFGIFLGTLAALKKGKPTDTATLLASVAGISAPSFFTALLIAYIFGMLLQPYTHLNFSGSLYAVNEVTGQTYLQLKNLILPAFTLGIRPLAIITQVTRSALLDELNKDYIRTAYAKGLSQRTVVFKHALRNAINPVITSITGWFAELLAGTFFVEYIFGWNGMGKLTVNALEKLDYPVVMGSVLLSAFLFIVVNMITDRLYKFADPRIR